MAGNKLTDAQDSPPIVTGIDVSYKSLCCRILFLVTQMELSFMCGDSFFICFRDFFLVAQYHSLFEKRVVFNNYSRSFICHIK